MANDVMLESYARDTALKLVYHLSKNGVACKAYDEPLRILLRARHDLADGLDPADWLECVNGAIREKDDPAGQVSTLDTLASAR